MRADAAVAIAIVTRQQLARERLHRPRTAAPSQSGWLESPRAARSSSSIHSIGSRSPATRSYALMLEAAARGWDVWTCQLEHLGLVGDDAVVDAVPTIVTPATTPAEAFQIGERARAPARRLRHRADAQGSAGRRHVPARDVDPRSRARQDAARQRSARPARAQRAPRGAAVPAAHAADDRHALGGAAARVPGRAGRRDRRQAGRRLRRPRHLRRRATAIRTRRRSSRPRPARARGGRSRSGTCRTAVEGDKRIVLVDGEPVGAVLRVPASAEARGNLHVGGRAVKTEIDARDREIIAAVAPFLREPRPDPRRARRDRRHADRAQHHVADRRPPHRAARRHATSPRRSSIASRSWPAHAADARRIARADVGHAVGIDIAEPQRRRGGDDRDGRGRTELAALTERAHDARRVGRRDAAQIGAPIAVDIGDRDRVRCKHGRLHDAGLRERGGRAISGHGLLGHGARTRDLPPNRRTNRRARRRRGPPGTRVRPRVAMSIGRRALRCTPRIRRRP